MACAETFDKNTVNMQTDAHTDLGNATFNNGSYIAVGKVTSTSGVKGYIRLTSYTGEPEDLFEYDNLELEGVPIKIEKVHAAKNGSFVCKISIASSIEEAKLLCNKEIVICRDALPQLEDGEYYLKDLIGFRVFDSSSNYVGDVCDICNYGADDILKYRMLNSSKAIMVSLNDKFIEDIDLKEKKVFLTSYDIL